MTEPETTMEASSIADAVVVKALRDIDPVMQSRLHAKLGARAADEDLLDIAYRIVDSPYGPLLLAATDKGLVRVAFSVEDHDHVLESLGSRISPRILAEPSRLEEATRELGEYFERRRQRFDLALDLRLAAGFRRSVLDHLSEITYGTTASYAAVASMAGNPKAVRAVGTACALNPLPLVIPCHRVVRSDGAIGNYLGGTEAKVSLLALEGKGDE